MKIPIRWSLYLVLILGAIPLVVFLAFGPGFTMPFMIFTWPGDRLLLLVKWSRGALYRPDVLESSLMSGLCWFLLAAAIDLTVTIRRSRYAV